VIGGNRYAKLCAICGQLVRPGMGDLRKRKVREGWATVVEWEVTHSNPKDCRWPEERRRLDGG
jgi:ribosomal protein L24E